MTSRLTGGHGRTSPPEKMSRHQNPDRGTWVERYQRARNLWVKPGTVQKSFTKRRAAKKRRQYADKAIRENLADS